MSKIRHIVSALMTTAALGLAANGAMAEGAKIFVVGGKPDDPFWSIVKRGAEDAGKVVVALDRSRGCRLSKPQAGRVTRACVFCFRTWSSACGSRTRSSAISVATGTDRERTPSL
jgi:hypothetical protein